MIAARHLKQAVREESSFWRAGLFVAIFAMLGLSAGPWLENLIYPVVKRNSVKVEYVQRTEDGKVHMVFSAVRPPRALFDCRRIGSSWYKDEFDGWQAITGVEVTGPLPGVRPAGRNISPINILPGWGEYSLRVSYDCGLPWVSYAWMGPIILQENKSASAYLRRLNG